VNNVRDQDAAVGRLALKPRGQNHAVAEDVVSLDNDLTEIDPDAKLNRLGRAWPRRACPRDRALYGNGALNSVYCAAELGKDAIAHCLHDATSMRGDLWMEDLREDLSNGSKSPSLIGRKQAAVASDVAGENRAKAPSNVLVSHAHLESREVYSGMRWLS
jgi:hypothetical protein